MKAILEFNMPEEKEEYESRYQGPNYKSCLFEVVDYLRRKIKYEELPEEQRLIFEQIKEEFWKIIDEHDINL